MKVAIDFTFRACSVFLGIGLGCSSIKMYIVALMHAIVWIIPSWLELRWSESRHEMYSTDVFFWTGFKFWGWYLTAQGEAHTIIYFFLTLLFQLAIHTIWMYNLFSAEKTSKRLFLSLFCCMSFGGRPSWLPRTIRILWENCLVISSGFNLCWIE